MQSLPTTVDDYLEHRVKQQRDALNSIEASIRFLREAVETSEREDQTGNIA
jgi:hypothetical protein